MRKFHCTLLNGRWEVNMQTWSCNKSTYLHLKMLTLHFQWGINILETTLYVLEKVNPERKGITMNANLHIMNFQLQNDGYYEQHILDCISSNNDTKLDVSPPCPSPDQVWCHNECCAPPWVSCSCSQSLQSEQCWLCPSEYPARSIIVLLLNIKCLQPYIGHIRHFPGAR